MSYRGSTGS